MKLIAPPFPDPVGGSGYFHVHAEHRRTAITHAIAAIRADAARELEGMAGNDLMQALCAPVADWAIETLVQGAWMREFHEWEKATKTYFEGQRQRNGAPPPKWSGPIAGVAGAGSHVQRVRAELAAFGAVVDADILNAIDGHRAAVNRAKHWDEHFVTEAEFTDLVDVVGRFWNALSPLEAFNPGA